MTEKKEIHFEIFDAGDIVRLEPERIVQEGSENDYDNNWIITTVTVKGGKFSGQFEADFMTTDFEKFKQELKTLYENLNGSATFSSLERQLELKIVGDGLGHFNVNVVASDHPVHGGKLSFTMGFDQTSLNELVHQLDTITQKFPIIGDFKIKNE